MRGLLLALAGLALALLLRQALGWDGFWGGFLAWCLWGAGFNRWSLAQFPDPGASSLALWRQAACWSWAWPALLAWAWLYLIFNRPSFPVPRGKDRGKE